MRMSGEDEGRRKGCCGRLSALLSAGEGRWCFGLIDVCCCLLTRSTLIRAAGSGLSACFPPCFSAVVVVMRSAGRGGGSCWLGCLFDGG